MFKRILMPIDLSNRHDSALRTAAELCRQSQGEIVLLHVIEQITGLSIEEERPFYDRLEASARKHLGQLGERLEAMQVAWRLEIRLGARGPEVVQYARENGSDLIVLTTRQPDPENPLSGWGSLSFRIALAAPCPILLVR